MIANVADNKAQANKTRRFASLFLAALLTSSLLVSLDVRRAEAAPSATSPFGVMFEGASASDITAAQDLGANWVRKRVLISDWSGTCWHCQPYKDAGFKMALTVRTDETGPSDPPANMSEYKSKLGEILDVIEPEVLGVQNEQDADVFYSGTTAQYHNELEAACSVAHARGIKCMDGGLTSHRVVAVVYQAYLDAGQKWRAYSFARRVAYNDMDFYRMVAPANAQRVKAFAREGEAFLKGLKAAKADYVNFHWYRHDAQAFAEAVAHLERITGLPAVTNEIGQHVEDPQVIAGHMSAVEQTGMDFAIWFSIDMVVKYPEPMQIYALHDPSGALRAHGAEYKRIATRF